MERERERQRERECFDFHFAEEKGKRVLKAGVSNFSGRGISVLKHVSLFY